MSATEPEGPVLNATRARAGSKGKPVLMILLVGLVLVVLALFGVWAMNAGRLQSTEANNGRQRADAQAFQAPESIVKQTDDVKAPGVPPGQSPSPADAQPPSN